MTDVTATDYLRQAADALVIAFYAETNPQRQRCIRNALEDLMTEIEHKPEARPASTTGKQRGRPRKKNGGEVATPETAE